MDVGSIPELPTGAAELLREQGVEELYPPQAEAVEAGVTAGEHLVASVPTASGKTMIAQLAMLSAIDRGGTALYIVPLRALASEKAEEFEALEALGVDVGVSTGNYEASGEWLGGKDLIVATSEKVDSLVRNGASWIEDLGCVVADEVHLIDDAQRGPTLEVTLAKLRQLNPGAQLVALSATVDNADEIAAWLDAELVDSDWRPIELRAGVHYGGAAHFDDGEQEELSVGASESATAGIVRDTLEEEGSTLVFVNSRRNAEAAARRLAGVVEPRLTPDERVELAELAADIRDVSDTETSDDLAEAVERGAAFHHAGLAGEHRSIVEDAFRDRLVKVVSATPTLAAGVNTPSRRVVVRDWRRYDGTAGGMQPLPVLEVHQMMGRAGRPGRDPYGEALLLAKSHDELEELQERYVEADPEPVRSKLAAEPALRTHVLATVASGFARSRSGLLEFLGETLYASQTAEDGRIERVVDDVLEYLRRNGFLEQDGDALSATSLGHTVSRLYLDPMSAATIVDGLESAVGAPGRERGAGANDGATATGSGAAANGGATADESANASDGETVEAAAGETADDPSPAEGDPEDAAGFQRASELDAADGSGGDAADDADAVTGEDAAATGEDDAAADVTDAASDDADAAATDADAAAPAEGDDESLSAEAPTDVEVTPLGLYHLVSRTPDTYELYLRSGDQETYSELFYERERELLGPAPTEYEEDRFEDWLAALKTAMLLEDWAEELDEERLTERYEVGPGDVRSKVDTAEWLLGAAEEVAAELDLPVVDDVRRARMRVQHGVKEELLDLVGVRGVGRKRARRLHAAGIADREALRTADKGPILGALRGREATAERVLENAGREDPSMAGVVPTDPVDAGEPLEGTGGGRGTRAGTASGRAGSTGSDDTDDDQSNLGDFS